MSRTTRRRRMVAAPVLVALAIGGLAACGDDDEETAADETTTTTEAGGAAEGDTAAFCDASVGYETMGEPEVDFETAPPDEIKAALQEFATTTAQPAVDELQATAPDELAEPVSVLVQTVDTVAETGDDSAVGSSEFGEAEAAIHEVALENCGWEAVDASGIDYGFEGVPTTVPAGIVSFEFTNDSSHGEAHEFVVFKKNEGVEQSATELLQLPQEEAMTMAQFTAAAFAPPGESDSVVAELEPGDYFVTCFIPVGASEENPEGSGPPHFMEGMVTEFTVE